MFVVIVHVDLLAVILYLSAAKSPRSPLNENVRQIIMKKIMNLTLNYLSCKQIFNFINNWYFYFKFFCKLLIIASIFDFMLRVWKCGIFNFSWKIPFLKDDITEFVAIKGYFVLLAGINVDICNILWHLTTKMIVYIVCCNM